MMKIKLDATFATNIQRLRRESTATERRMGTTVFLARSSAPGGHVRAGPPGRLGCVVVAVRFGEDDGRGERLARRRRRPGRSHRRVRRHRGAGTRSRAGKCPEARSGTFARDAGGGVAGGGGTAAAASEGGGFAAGRRRDALGGGGQRFRALSLLTPGVIGTGAFFAGSGAFAAVFASGFFSSNIAAASVASSAAASQFSWRTRARVHGCVPFSLLAASLRRRHPPARLYSSP